MFKNSRKAITPGLLVIMILANAGEQLFSVQADLNERLMAIERRARMPGADLSRLEAEALSLTQQFRSPEDLGKIYARSAQLYRVSIKPGAVRDRDNLIKIRDFSAKALEYPLALHDHVRAYMDMGSAIWGLSNETGEDWPRDRRDIAISLLSGLKLLLDNGVPSEPIPLPGVDKIDCGDPQNPICKAMQEEHDRQLEARRGAEEIQKLALMRTTLMDSIISVYSVDGQAMEELKEISSQILKDDALVSNLIAKVKAGRVR